MPGRRIEREKLAELRPPRRGADREGMLSSRARHQAAVRSTSSYKEGPRGFRSDRSASRSVGLKLNSQLVVDVVKSLQCLAVHAENKRSNRDCDFAIVGFGEGGGERTSEASTDPRGPGERVTPYTSEQRASHGATVTERRVPGRYIVDENLQFCWNRYLYYTNDNRTCRHTDRQVYRIG